MLNATTHQIDHFNRRLYDRIQLKEKHLVIGKSQLLSVDSLYNAPYLVLDNLLIVAIDQNYLLTFDLANNERFAEKHTGRILPLDLPTGHNQPLTLKPSQLSNQFYLIAGNRYIIKFCINEHKEINYITRELSLAACKKQDKTAKSTNLESRLASTSLSADGRFMLTNKGQLFDLKKQRAIPYHIAHNGMTGKVELINAYQDTLALLMLPYRHQKFDTTIKIATLSPSADGEAQYRGNIDHHIHCDIAVNNYALSHDAQHLAVTDGANILVYHLNTNESYTTCEEIQRTSYNHLVEINDIEFSSDGSQLIVRNRHQLEEWDCYEITDNPLIPLPSYEPLTSVNGFREAIAI